MSDLNEEFKDDTDCTEETLNEDLKNSVEAESDIDNDENNSDSESSDSDKKSFLGKKKSNSEIKKLNSKIEEQDSMISELRDRYARLAAEYDNFKKRTSKELDGRYNDAKCDVLKSILPVIDNFERALATFSDDDPQKEGVSLILEQFKGILSVNGVSEIEALGAEFNPQYHNAVMHIDDAELGENVVAEVFEKGYKTADRVLRYSMVKVAN